MFWKVKDLWIFEGRYFGVILVIKNLQMYDPRFVLCNNINLKWDKMNRYLVLINQLYFV